MPVRRWTEPAPPIATAVVKATVCAGSRRGRSARAVRRCRLFVGLKSGGGGGMMHRSRHSEPATVLAVVVAHHPHSPNPAALSRERGHPVNSADPWTRGRLRHRQPATALTVIMALHRHPSPQPRHATSIGAARRQRLVGVTDGHRQPVTALPPSWRPMPSWHVIMALHHRSVEPQARQACYRRGHPVNDSEATEHHRPLC